MSLYLVNITTIDTFKSRYKYVDRFFNFNKCIIYVYYAPIRKIKTPDLWNLCPNVEDVNVVSMVSGCVDMNGVVFGSS